ALPTAPHPDYCDLLHSLTVMGELSILFGILQTFGFFGSSEIKYTRNYTYRESKRKLFRDYKLFIFLAWIAYLKNVPLSTLG
ncbi:MAG: hypothetical protein U0M06_12965, partial [Clostridia bacterium]|nr:hypothetical protein [Clostridia bacterium]